MICPNCKRHLEADSNFCRFCGTKLDSEFVIDKIYAWKNRYYKSTPNGQESWSYNSFNYFWNYKSAIDAFNKEYESLRRLQSANPQYDVRLVQNSPCPLIDSGDDAGCCAYNSLRNSFKFFDYFRNYNGKLIHQRPELQVAKIHGPITINPKLKTNIKLFIYSEEVRVIGNYCNDLGWNTSEEFYSDGDNALQRINEELKRYSHFHNWIIEKMDKRSTYLSEINKLESVYYYEVEVKNLGVLMARYTILAKYL